MITIEQALLQVGEELKKVMTQTLQKNGSYNTGNLANSIEYTVEKKDYEYNLVRRMLTYGVYVDGGYGRKPGKMPPVQDIIEWIQFKKIPIPTGFTLESFAFVVARSIGKKGTNPKPRPFITPSINFVLNTTAKNILTEASINEVTVNIDSQLKSIKVKA